ncbi:MAG: AMP-binding protein [Pseudomonadota bacterium]
MSSDTLEFSNLVDRLDWLAETHPDQVALVFGETSLTFSQLRQHSAIAANRLSSDFDIGHGDRVGWLGLNHPTILVLLFACARIGAILLPFNSRLAEAEYHYLMGHAEPSVIIHDDAFLDMANALRNRHGVASISQDDLITQPTTRDELPPMGNESNPLLLVYTSGTTGRPKGVVLNHRALAVNISNCHDIFGFAPGGRVLITLPLFHVGGLCILLLPALMHGATVHLHQRFDPQSTISDIEKYKITGTLLVPAQMAAIMQPALWDSADFSSLDFLAVGSSIIPQQQIDAFHALGIPVTQVYGATETGPAAIALPLSETERKSGSAGIAVKHCDIELRSDKGTVCAVGDRGVVYVHGENLMSHYWRSEEETSAVLNDGWYNTGDIGVADEDGYYWIVDRAKDMIISGGENIYPAEIEAVSLEHPAISAIAVVGKPHDVWGETPVAVIELGTGAALSADEYLEFLQNRIARYKQPRSVVFLDELPRNVMGKIEKPVLRKMVANTD